MSNGVPWQLVVEGHRDGNVAGHFASIALMKRACLLPYPHVQLLFGLRQGRCESGLRPDTFAVSVYLRSDVDLLRFRSVFPIRAGRQ